MEGSPVLCAKQLLGKGGTRAAKRSVFFSRQCHRSGLRVHPDDRWWSGAVTRVVIGVFAGLLNRVFVCILFVLARLYAALRCHAAIVTRGLSLTAGKVHFSTWLIL